MSATLLRAVFNWRLAKPLLFALALGQAGAGCVTNGDRKGGGRLSLGTGGKNTVDSIRLFTSPTVQNFDNTPGPDGFSAKIYAIENGSAKPVKIRSGAIEFALFETVAEGEPLQIWKFNSAVLSRHMSETRIGVAYNFQMRWTPDKAPKKKAAIVALYRAPDGRVVRAVPVVLALAP